jgi:hypothetical protein
MWNLFQKNHNIWKKGLDKSTCRVYTINMTVEKDYLLTITDLFGYHDSCNGDSYMDSEQIIIEQSNFINSQITFGAEYYDGSYNQASERYLCRALN